MAKNTYYKDLKENQLARFNEYKNDMPYFAHDFLDEKRRTRQPATALAYAYDLMVFFEYLKDNNPDLKNCKIKDIPLSAVDSLDFRDINEYQDFLENSANFHNNTRAINRKMSALRGFYSYGCSHEILASNATDGASKRIDPKRNDITARLDNQEVQKLMSTVKNSDLPGRMAACAENTKLRDTAIITLFLGTGMRVSELVSLNISDFSFDNLELTVTRKGGKSMTLYYNEDVRDALISYIELERPETEEDALFLSNRRTRITVRSVERLVKKYASRISSKNISPHRLRKTYGTGLYEASGDIKLVADVLGHTSISVTSKHYIDQSERNRRFAGSVKLYQEDESPGRD